MIFPELPGALVTVNSRTILAMSVSLKRELERFVLVTVIVLPTSSATQASSVSEYGFVVVKYSSFTLSPSNRAK